MNDAQSRESKVGEKSGIGLLHKRLHLAVDAQIMVL